MNEAILGIKSDLFQDTRTRDLVEATYRRSVSFPAQGFNSAVIFTPPVWPKSLQATESSPGLSFLRGLLPALDSLEPSSNPIKPFLALGCAFIFNGGSPVSSDQIIAMFESRSEKLSKFHHDVRIAWDIEREDSGEKAKRTVMYESTSITVFRKDSEQLGVKVSEFNIIEIEKDDQGFWKAIELRTFMDGKPIQERVSKLQEQKLM
ncbi:hypothetical protein FQN54_009822 [Arachnomyces sp. PD_36]|nr:hypothetical protein FQN54_009822 [Arachnomyces sp. PD_36]